MVIVLSNADAAGGTVIFPSLHGIQTDHAKSIDLLPLTEEGVIMMLDGLFRRDYERSEEDDRRTKNNSLSDVDPSDPDIDDC